MFDILASGPMKTRGRTGGLTARPFFSNLLSNSAKYTERGGRVWLSAERRRGEVVVSVRDTGIGIGLALVKGLVEMHGGTVRIASLSAR